MQFFPEIPISMKTVNFQAVGYVEIAFFFIKTGNLSDKRLVFSRKNIQDPTAELFRESNVGDPNN